MADNVTQIPRRQATEAELVADFADTAQLHGYKVTKHTVAVDHESQETRLSVSLVRGNPEQGVLDLKEPQGGRGRKKPAQPGGDGGAGSEG